MYICSLLCTGQRQGDRDTGEGQGVGRGQGSSAHNLNAQAAHNLCTQPVHTTSVHNLLCTTSTGCTSKHKKSNHGTYMCVYVCMSWFTKTQFLFLTALIRKE